MGAMPMEQLRSLLTDAFPDATELSVDDRTGTGDHFQVTVASPRFHGLPLLDQHRLVNEALAIPLADGTIHELRIRTKAVAASGARPGSDRRPRDDRREGTA
jgi:stress-induced morphogen